MCRTILAESPDTGNRAVSTTRSRSLQRRLVPAGSGGSGSMVIDIGSRRVTYRRQPPAAQLAGGGLLLAAPFGQPVHVVSPPGSVAVIRMPEPLLRVFRALLGHLVPGLLITRRVHHGGDV